MGQKKHFKRRFVINKYLSPRFNAENLQLATSETTSQVVLLQLQGNKNPQIIQSLAKNSSLPKRKRLLMAKKLINFPRTQISSREKIQFLEILLDQDFEHNQKVILNSLKKQILQDETQRIIDSFLPNSKNTKSLILDQYSSTSKIFHDLDIKIPKRFSEKLFRPWLITLIYALHLNKEKLFFRSDQFVERNKTWLKEFNEHNQILQILDLNVEPILDLQTPLFQQAVLILLVTHDFEAVNELIDSVETIVPSYIEQKQFYEAKKEEAARMEREKYLELQEEKRAARKILINQKASEMLQEIKIKTLGAIKSDLLLGSKNGLDLHNNGFSWGVRPENVFSQYTNKVNAQITSLYYYNSQEIKVAMQKLFDEDSEHQEFSQFIEHLDCRQYRGNLRQFDPFPLEILSYPDIDFEKAAMEYEKWSKDHIRSVLSADRGNVPEILKVVMPAWTTISQYFKETAIFFLENLGIVFSFNDFKLAIHIAFVASKKAEFGLRGQWLITLSGLPQEYSREVEIMGWKKLEESRFRFQNRFANLLSDDEDYWLLEQDEAIIAEGEIGKLIEGLLYEVHGLTAESASSFIRQVSPEIRARRQRLIDLIFRIRRYRSAVRYRPYLGYCSNPSCGLPLSDPLSLARGYGPTCWANLSREGVTHRDLTTDYDRIYFETPVSLEKWQDSLAEFFENAFCR